MLVCYSDATLVESIGYQGWGFVVIDGEHGTLEPRDCENAARAAELRNVTPIVRGRRTIPRSSSATWIRRPGSARAHGQLGRRGRACGQC
jgi:2-keto-3-deoxy-L-rhamnonate aldolase RhmA